MKWSRASSQGHFSVVSRVQYRTLSISFCCYVYSHCPLDSLSFWRESIHTFTSPIPYRLHRLYRQTSVAVYTKCSCLISWRVSYNQLWMGHVTRKSWRKWKLLCWLKGRRYCSLSSLIVIIVPSPRWLWCLLQCFSFSMSSFPMWKAFSCSRCRPFCHSFGSVQPHFDPASQVTGVCSVVFKLCFSVQCISVLHPKVSSLVMCFTSTPSSYYVGLLVNIS